MRILFMLPINNEAQCLNLGQRPIQQGQRPGDIKVDARHLFTFLQIEPRGFCILWRNLIGKTATRPAAI
tara:strand:- start:2721 stop:2927 length:207 start_codon:yes stop_codon:yes gene_type:complete